MTNSGNFITYLATYGEQSFTTSSFSLIDAAICAQLAYFPFKELPVDRLGAVTPDMAHHLAQHTWAEADNRALLIALATSRRYRDVQWLSPVDRLDREREQQFSAITFALGNDTYYVAFRGTRASFVDWKEDFNLTFSPTIPSQRAGLTYLTTLMSRFPGKYYIGGHSKGGNLAAYALGHLDATARQNIAMAYNFDGPGSSAPMPATARRKLLKLVPENSIIGIILDPSQDFGVVASTASGFKQHDMFTWAVADRNFVYLEATDKRTQYAQRTLAAWLAGLDDATKQQALAAAYQLFTETQADTFKELAAQWPTNGRTIVTGLVHADPTNKAAWRRVLGALWQAVLTTTPHPQLPFGPKDDDADK